MSDSDLIRAAIGWLIVAGIAFAPVWFALLIAAIDYCGRKSRA